MAGSGLRPDWTSDACATAAARSAYTALVTGKFADTVTVDLPSDRHTAFALTGELLSAEMATAAVTKDAEDDPDLTHQATVAARLRPGTPGGGLQVPGWPGGGHDDHARATAASGSLMVSELLDGHVALDVEAVHGDIRVNCDTCIYRTAIPDFSDRAGQPQRPHHPGRERSRAQPRRPRGSSRLKDAIEGH